MISCLYIQSNNPHTFLVITLDPPIRKGQTLYPHIVIQVYIFILLLISHSLCGSSPWTFNNHFFYEQFMTEAVATTELLLSEEVLAEKYKDRLQSSYNVIYLSAFKQYNFLSSF
jgi:structure-specific recognition protein 1